MLAVDLDAPEPSLREKILLVQSDTQLSGLDLEGARIFAQHGRYRVYATGEAVSKAGEFQDEVHLLFRGAVKVENAKGQSFVVRAPGGLGWPSLLTGLPAIDAVATEPCMMLSFSSETILDFFEMNFSLTRNAIRLTSEETLRKTGGLPRKAGDDFVSELGEYPAQPATLAQRVMEIRGSALFEGQNAEAAGALARADEEVRYDAGTVLWHAGEAADSGLRLRYGHVRCESPSGDVVRIGPPYVIGMLEVMANQPRGYEAVCETPVVAYRSVGTAFFGVLEDHFDVAHELMRILTLSGFLAD